MILFNSQKEFKIVNLIEKKSVAFDEMEYFYNSDRDSLQLFLGLVRVWIFTFSSGVSYARQNFSKKHSDFKTSQTIFIRASRLLCSGG